MFMDELNQLEGRQIGQQVSPWHRLSRLREMHGEDEGDEPDEGYARCRKHEPILFVRPDWTAVRS